MKYIKVPAVLVPRTRAGKPFKSREREGEPESDIDQISIFDALVDYYLPEVRLSEKQPPHPELKIGTGATGNRRQRELDRAFRDAKPGDIVQVSEETHAKVKTIMDEKNWAGASYFGSLFILFEDAWNAATDEAPKATDPVSTGNAGATAAPPQAQASA